MELQLEDIEAQLAFANYLKWCEVSKRTPTLRNWDEYRVFKAQCMAQPIPNE